MKTILMVDDDKTLRKIYKTYLTAEGFHVLEAETGEEALMGFSGRNLDAILLDIRMPGVNGWALVSTLTQYHPEAKIIVFSCYPLHVQKEMIPQAVAYYDKSMGFKALLTQLKKAFQPEPSPVI